MISVVCCLAFEGDSLDFSEITQLVGVDPTRTRRAEVQHPTIVPRDTWEFQVEAWGSPEFGLSSDGGEPWVEIIEPLERLSRVVAGREDDIAAYCRSKAIEVQFVVVPSSSRDEVPILDLSTPFVTTMARLGASLVIDPYLYFGSDYAQEICPTNSHSEDPAEGVEMSVKLVFSATPGVMSAEQFGDRMSGLASRIGRNHAEQVFGRFGDSPSSQLERLEEYLERNTKKLQELTGVEVRLIVRGITIDTACNALIEPHLSTLLGQLGITMEILAEPG